MARKLLQSNFLFVLPLMGMQLIESVSSCFFVGRVWEWVRLSAVVLAWGITFLHSGALPPQTFKGGRDDKVIGALLRGKPLAFSRLDLSLSGILDHLLTMKG